MVNRNYKFEKRQKDLAKQKKKEEKLQRKLTRKQSDEDGQPDNGPGVDSEEQTPADKDGES